MEDKHTWNEGTRNNAIQTWSVDAITSAAARLGVPAIDLAEALQDGGIAELVQFAESYKDYADSDVRSMLAKIRKEGE